MSSERKILVVHESRHGQTRKIAERIAEALEARGTAVTLTEVARVPENLALADFDAVAIGSSVHFGRYGRATAAFVRRHGDVLTHVPSAFFSVSGWAIEGTPAARARVEETVDRFLTDTGWRPDLVARFAGAVPYTRYNPLLRFVMRRIQGRAGRSTDTSRDHEYTDWEAVEAFARRLIRSAGTKAAAGRV